jgi:hypothetical protein
MMEWQTGAMKMAEYDGNLTVKEARRKYFALFGLGEGGYTDRWVKIKFGPLPILFPNTKARIEAVKRHDLHHVATGYDADWIGEAEIGAWEIASGCGRFYAAWILNLYAVGVGLVLSPGAILRAFLKGRKEGNLYLQPFPADILSVRVLQLRECLQISSITPNSKRIDYLLFAAWSFTALALWLVSMGTVPTLLVLLLKSITTVLRT